MSIGPFQARGVRGGRQARLDGSWSGLHGSSLAVAIHSAGVAQPGITLVVTRSSHQGQLLARDLELLSTSPLPVWLFPDHETLPYDPVLAAPGHRGRPDQDTGVARFRAARHSPGAGFVAVAAPAAVGIHPAAQFRPRRRARLEVEAFRSRLHHAGYEPAEQVYQAGQYAVRGSVIDVFPAGSATPLRLDLFDEEIDSIRLFDPESQLSTGKIEQVALLPAREYPCDEAGLEAFRRAFRHRFDVDTRQVTLYQDLRAGVHPQGLEQYLPLFHERTSFLLDYLRTPPHLLIQDGAREAADDLERRTRSVGSSAGTTSNARSSIPTSCFSPAGMRERLGRLATVALSAPDDRRQGATVFATEAAPDLYIHERGRDGRDPCWASSSASPAAYCSRQTPPGAAKSCDPRWLRLALRRKRSRALPGSRPPPGSGWPCCRWMTVS